MGTINHHAIVVTSGSAGDIERARDRAIELWLVVIGPGRSPLNGYQSILICPDGSKEGWGDSKIGDMRRAAFIEWMKSQRYEDGSSPYAWVEVAYSPDYEKAEVTRHEWQEA